MHIRTGSKTLRGFPQLVHPTHKNPDVPTALLEQSSMIDFSQPDSQTPGTSYLWVGKDHHLNRAEVQELVVHLQRWLDKGHL